MSATLNYTATTTVGDLLVRATARTPDKDAIRFPDQNRSFRQLHQAAMLRARELYGLGVRPGDHVGIFLPSCIEYLEYYFGLAYLGAVSVPMNARYREHELRYQTVNADLVHIISTTQVAEGLDFRARLHQAFPALRDAPPDQPISLPEAPRLRGITLLTDEPSAGCLRQSVSQRFAADVEDALIDRLRCAVTLRQTALILYTSGTTSNPKGCMISHEALVRTGMGLAERYGMTDRDAFWSPLPMFHVGALFPLCAAYHAGATYIGMQHFDAGAALRLVREARPTIGYPSFALFLSDMVYHPDFRAEDMASLRLINCSMALSPEPFRELMRKSFPNAVFVGTYGMTETAGTVTTSDPADSEAERFNRLGRPFDGLSVRIAREDGTEAAPGEIGEICVKGFSIFTEYYGDPEKTAEAKRDGWFHTGDLGSLDAAGTLMFHGRAKDMLKVGGENVAALEIEMVVAQHPAVKTCQVVGKPDPRLQEVPVAFVELVPGQSVDPAALIAYCKTRIASFKVPRDVHFIAEWPMSASKIQKFKLRDMVQEMAADSCAAQ
ncbi:fatty-acyl-CoA synthase [Paracoccus pantotrophus]|nr:fatty-acyl-CoA synthase [Paracoccus pantotrophus]